ncbi:MAG: V-type ATP synthase subunit A [Candidatus Marinimicrobia bacterium]|nr:V-type ATP synthase subunit A [Candidatus Neomarinimicrobiota bacterium]
MATVIGKVSRVLGPVVHAAALDKAQMLEFVEVGPDHLIGEIVRLHNDQIIIQVYEDTTGLAPGVDVYGSGLPLSVELGPGLIGTIYDGVQRPLAEIKKVSDQYIHRGIKVPALDRKKRWPFVPIVSTGDTVSGGQAIGTVAETARITQKILVPPTISGRVIKIAPAGEYRIEDEICVIESGNNRHSLTLFQRWPVRQPRPVQNRQTTNLPMITGQRVIDTLFPIAKGGTVAIPGGFGTGKTMVEHQIAKWSDADIVVYIGCGERGNEMTDVLNEFPKLIDPRSGRPLMERTVLIANTSNMPVAAREASIYTGITIAEYFRDMGYHVAIMADSTSRWAEALRELSGRMEEMPAEEGFPAYLPTRLAEFYERAGLFETLNHETGSITIVGAISPPGGDFSEPVTQHTKRFVRVFLALDRDLANARHYPSISWLDSYSEYVEAVAAWWQEKADPDWAELRQEILELLQKEAKLQQVVKLVGADVLPDSQRIILEVCNLFKNIFLQQSAYDKIDTYSTIQKQVKMLRIIVTFYRLAAEALKHGATLYKIKRTKSIRAIMNMKYKISNEETDKLDKILTELNQELASLGRLNF